MTTTDVTLIVALIAAIAAIIAPLITTLLTTHSAYKLKTIDLLFNAKLDAYKQFANIAFSVKEDLLPDNLEELHKAWSYASLFSAPDTRRKLNQYYKRLLNSTDTDADLSEFSISLVDVIDAMQTELYHFRKYYKKRNNS